MKRFVAAVLVIALSFIISCSKSEPKQPTPKTLLNPKNNTTIQRSITIPKDILFDPNLFNQEEIFFVPISYYAPVLDNTQATLRLLVPLFYHPDYGMSQPTTINIIEADSLELDGQFLRIYSTESSKLKSLPGQPGIGLNYFTQETFTMIMYADSTLNIIPNGVYSSQWLSVPNKDILGFYFLVTPYLIH